MLSKEFHRTGPLKEVTSYPLWLQRVVQETCGDKSRVVHHPVFAMMRDATLPAAMLRQFLTGVWLTIERFPQFMAMNLQKIQFGDSAGARMARRYLIQNIRVEQKHADYWLASAEAGGLSLTDLRDAKNCAEQQALAHWCWYISAQPSLAVGVAATNYAVEGATGEWSCLVCSKDAYERSLPQSCRVSAMRWLRVHAEYDDTHPWEALEIVATLLGNNPPAAEVDAIRAAVRASYSYMGLALDGVLGADAAHTTRESGASAGLLPVRSDSARHARRRTPAERAIATV